MAVLYYISFLALLQLACAREYKAYGTMKNVALQHVFHVTRAATDMDCCNACSMNATCVAANYERSTGTCELNDKHPHMEGAGVQKVASASKTVYFLTAGCRAPWSAFQDHCYMYLYKPAPLTWSEAEAHCVSLGGHLTDIHDDEKTQFVGKFVTEYMWLGCRAPWSAFRDHCYLFNPESLSWSAAEAHCVSLDGHLADIHDDEENQFVGKMAATTADTWIGMTDLWGDEHRRWSSGRLVEFNHFRSGNPDCWRNIEDCVIMDKRNDWNDLPCGYNRPSVCKKPCYIS